VHAAILTLRRASQPDDVIAGLAASTPPCACAAAIVVVASAPQHVRRTGGLTFDRARRHADVVGGRAGAVIAWTKGTCSLAAHRTSLRARHYPRCARLDGVIRERTDRTKAENGTASMKRRRTRRPAGRLAGCALRRRRRRPITQMRRGGGGGSNLATSSSSSSTPIT